MKTTTYIDEILISGASIIGKAHVDCSIHNQDSFLAKKTSYGTALCVSDGVGSNKYSEFGSQAVCKAIFKVFKLYYKKKITKEDLGKKIEYYYQKFVWISRRKEAASTCLFALVYNNSEIIIGQAGDGIILIKVNDRFIVFKNKTDEYLNEVIPLVCNEKYLHWKIRNLKFDFSENRKLMILLSTDGISEDIIPDKREQFLEYFCKLSLSGKKSDTLYNELSNWSVPGSFDDKTIVTLVWENKI